jgi:peptidoglycan/LPS O-acetylase OafA/YrhL
MERKNFIFISYLRVVAVTMIIFDHLGGIRNQNWLITKVIRFLFCNPLNMIQDFGAFGVSLFFLISGFLFVHTCKDNVNILKSFSRKFIRLYIPLEVSFIFFYIIQKLFWLLASQGEYWNQFSNKDWILSGTLVGYFTGKGDVINGTTWFLIPLILFYLVGTLVGSFIHKKPIKAVLIIEFIIFLIISGSYLYVKILGNKVNMLITPNILLNYGFFMYIPVQGILIYYVYFNYINKKLSLSLSMINYVLMLISIYLFNNQYYTENPYIVSIIYATLIFIICLLLNESFKENKWINEISNVSYSLYLTHMTFGSLILSMFEKHIMYTVLFVITLLIIILISEIQHYLIEERLVPNVMKLLK